MFLLTCSAGLSSCGEFAAEVAMKAFRFAGLPACAATVATATRLSNNTNLLLFIVCRSLPFASLRPQFLAARRRRSTVPIGPSTNRRAMFGRGSQVIEDERVMLDGH